MDWHNRWVHFRVRDVHVPEAEQLLMAMHGDDVLQGTVLETVEGEAQQGLFAVVHVDDPAITQPLIVPIGKVCADSDSNPDASAR